MAKSEIWRLGVFLTVTLMLCSLGMLITAEITMRYIVVENDITGKTIYVGIWDICDEKECDLEPKDAYVTDHWRRSSLILMFGTICLFMAWALLCLMYSHWSDDSDTCAFSGFFGGLSFFAAYCLVVGEIIGFSENQKTVDYPPGWKYSYGYSYYLAIVSVHLGLIGLFIHPILYILCAPCIDDGGKECCISCQQDCYIRCLVCCLACQAKVGHSDKIQSPSIQENPVGDSTTFEESSFYSTPVEVIDKQCPPRATTVLEERHPTVPDKPTDVEQPAGTEQTNTDIVQTTDRETPVIEQACTDNDISVANKESTRSYSSFSVHFSG